QSQYRQFLSQQLPSKEQFKPGAISRIGAILSGLSTGITRGAGEGYATAQGILDEPYREGLERYKLQAGRLGEAAKVEQENELNRVKLARDILESQDRQRRAAIEEEVGRGRIANWESLAKSRGNSKPVGSSYLDLNTGIRYQNMQNPDTGEITAVRLGKFGRTTQEEIGLAGGRAGAIERARQPFAEALLKQRGEQAQELADYQDELIRGEAGAGTISVLKDVYYV